ncbi:hypothetical protein M5D96_013015, partial [Drosophila gunungcola]
MCEKSYEIGGDKNNGFCGDALSCCENVCQKTYVPVWGCKKYELFWGEKSDTTENKCSLQLPVFVFDLRLWRPRHSALIIS